MPHPWALAPTGAPRTSLAFLERRSKDDEIRVNVSHLVHASGINTINITRDNEVRVNVSRLVHTSGINGIHHVIIRHLGRSGGPVCVCVRMRVCATGPLDFR